MKISIIYDGIPNTSTGGGAFTIFTISKMLKDSGHEVYAIILVAKDQMSSKDKEHIKNFKNTVSALQIIYKDIKPFTVWKKIFNKFFVSIESIYPESAYRNEVKQAVNLIKPDRVLIYHFQALAAAAAVDDSYIKMALVGDPQFEVVKFRFNYFIKKLSIKHVLLLPFFPIIYLKHLYYDTKLLRSYKRVGAFAAQHAKELSVILGRECMYFQTPIIDCLNTFNEAYIKHQKFFTRDKFKILLLGHLKGIVALTGIDLFVKTILPILIDKIGEDNFEVSVVGSYFDSLPQNLRSALLSSKVVKIKGHVPSLDEEFFSSHIFLVPPPIKLGMRVRVVTGMSYGSTTVVHAANLVGMPELIDGENCLVGENGEELAEKIVACYEGKYNLDKIGQRARQDFEKYFKSDVAVKRISDELLKK